MRMGDAWKGAEWIMHDASGHDIFGGGALGDKVI